MNNLFINQNYLNLETFRKNGLGVKTPVWFVQDGDTLFVRTFSKSGKVKRIRNNNQVNIAPCKMNGALLGDWVQALACEIKEDEFDRKIDKLLDKKYRLLKKIFFRGGSNNRSYTTLELKVRE